MLKFILKGISAFITILTIATTMMPATVSEQQALGYAPARMDLIQMRLARAMMQVAPDAAVSFYAQATKLPEDTVRGYLMAKAEGSFMAEADAHTAEPIEPHHSVGSAKFIKLD